MIKEDDDVVDSDVKNKKETGKLTEGGEYGKIDQ